MTDTLLPFTDGSSSGAWSVVGASSIADALDDSDDASYVWIDGAAVNDFFDLKLDNACGAVDEDATEDVVLSFRAKVLAAGQRTCEISVAIYEGDPSSGGTLIGARKQNLDEAWTQVDAGFSWQVVLANISDFNAVWLRISVSKMTGGGDPAQPAISLGQVALPGTISKNVAMPSTRTVEIGTRYNVRLVEGGVRLRKCTFDGLEWYDKQGQQLEGIREFEVDDF